LDLTLSFYFNCTTNLFSEPPISPIDCLRFKEKQSYVIVLTGNETDQVNWFGICKENVRVMVLKAQVAGYDWVIGFAGVIGQGFMLDCETGMGCGDSEDSHGHCGYNNTRKDVKVQSNHCRGMLIFFNVNYI
jgi:hypothetical protein